MEPKPLGRHKFMTRGEIQSGMRPLKDNEEVWETRQSLQNVSGMFWLA